MAAGAEYYDFVLIGKTGMGKSTLGNKLLQPEKVRVDTTLQRFTSKFVGLLRNSPQPHMEGQNRFATTDDVSSDNADMRAQSVTSVCELLANNETKVRVLDVPGFSDSGALKESIGKPVSVYEGNSQIVRWMVRIQAATPDLRVRRMVYFLPIRGVLERADGTMQEELQILHYFFGNAIFDCMVVVASNHRKYQKMGYDESSREESKTVFHRALKQATKNDRIGCPPIVYIGIDESGAEVTEKLQSARVLKDEPLKLEFRDDVCSRCSVKIRKLGGERVGVVDTAGNLIEYKESKCHPCFVQKYSTWTKFWGGVGHTVTLGGALIYSKISGDKVWPGFTNSDEHCPNCKNFPGSKGCSYAGGTITCDSENFKVEHTNAL